MSADRTLQRVWYQRVPFALFLLLIPLSLLFGILSAARRFLYRIGVLRTVRVARPVLVVGNVSVGGTGKTPLVIWLAERLESRGCTVGLITRGYGGRATHWPQDVTAATSPEQVGDEPVLLATRTRAIVVAGPDRVADAQRAIERGATIVVCDDGLQHYRLGRDAEIVVLDAQRGFGNGWLLPAGPLRERAPRAGRADLTVKTVRGNTGSIRNGSEILSVQALQEAINVRTGERRAVATFIGQRVHALAAIGHPESFFVMLNDLGLVVTAHPLSDHAVLNAQDLAFGDDLPVLMTEKDAVKCRAFANERHWAVPLTVTFSDADEQRLTKLLDRLIRESQTTDEGGGSS